MSDEPSWDLYRTFLHVLDERSLSGAARALGLAQPTVARHIDALEAAVGYELFLRTQRGLAPTEAATELGAYARSLASTSAALLRAASSHASEVRGVVRISASEVVGIEHLPPILAQLRRQHPALTLELMLSNAVEDLLRREADIAVRMVEPAQGVLVSRRAGAIPLGLYARRDYIAHRGMPASTDELSGHDLIGFDRETPAIRAFVSQYPWIARKSLALRTDSDVAQLAAIRAGFGIGICQVPLAARSPDLVRVLEAAFHVELGVWIVMHEDLRSSPRCRAVFDALVAGMARLG